MIAMPDNVEQCSKARRWLHSRTGSQQNQWFTVGSVKFGQDQKLAETGIMKLSRRRLKLKTTLL